MHAYAIKDEKIGEFINPFFGKNDFDVMRSLSNIVKDPDNMLCKFAADFSLWRIGGFNETTGLAEYSPTHVINLTALKEVSKNV